MTEGSVGGAKPGPRRDWAEVANEYRDLSDAEQLRIFEAFVDRTRDIPAAATSVFILAPDTEHWIKRRSDVRDDTMIRAEGRQEAAERLAAKAAADFESRFGLLDLRTMPEPEPPALLLRTDGAAYLYLGQRNGCFGPSEDGKTWLMLYAAAQELKAGRPVMMVDYENGGRIIRRRLLDLGVTPDQLAGLWYADMISERIALPRGYAERTAHEFYEKGGRLVLIEAITPIMARRGLKPNEADDVETFFEEDVDPWAIAGCAPVAMDNTPKSDPMSQLGSQHKRAGNRGVSLNVINKVRFSQIDIGYSQVYVDKDRPGGTAWNRTSDGKRYAGDMHVIPSGSGLLTVEFVPPGAALSDGRMPPSVVAAAGTVSKDERTALAVEEYVLEYHSDARPATQTDILAAMAKVKASSTQPGDEWDVHVHKNYVVPVVLGKRDRATGKVTVDGMVQAGVLRNVSTSEKKWAIVGPVDDE